ncbi:MAG: hypothetical protein HON90_00465 [Halobacteriovoraceae bacterium]|nr:hypothetical protein [Halobacteriovoraceae bacterium]
MNKDETHLLIKSLLSKRDVKSNINFDQKLDEYFFGSYCTHELKVNNGEEQAYQHLSSTALMTSYLDYYQILKDIPPDQTLCDLGAGYCRGTFLANYLSLNYCISIEYIGTRVAAVKQALKKFNYPIDEVLARNLDYYAIPSAFAYYLYFPKNKTLDTVIAKIFNQASPYLYVCESHGEVLEYLGLFKNVTTIAYFECSLPRHSSQIIKYKVEALNENINWEDDFALWFIQNKHNKAYTICFKYYSHFLAQYLDWIISINELELITHNKNIALRHDSGRIILINEGEEITKITTLYKETLLKVKNKKFKKILKAESFWLEIADGSYEKFY